MSIRGWNAAPGTWIGMAMIAAMVLAAVFVPVFSPYSPLRTAGEALQRPSATHLFGTDHLGYDVFTRTFTAARLDLTLALIGTAIPLVIGTVVGAVLGMSQGRMPAAVNSLIDGINAFPNLVLVIALVAVLGPGPQGLLFALILTNWARYARIARARAVVVSGQSYVVATSILAYSRSRRLARHVIPNVSSVTTAYALSDFVIVIIAIAGLSFLGLGVRPPTPEWGAMMNEGRLYLATAWWPSVFPGLALSWIGIGIAITAEGLSRREGRAI